MTYAIEILEKERHQLEIILSAWELDHYPDTRKERDSRLKDTNQALEILTVSKHLSKCDYCEKGIPKNQGIHICRECSL